MTKFCKFCNKDHELPLVGKSNSFWYWQKNSTKLGGTSVCKVKRAGGNYSWEKANPEVAKAKHKKYRTLRRSTPHGRLRHSFSSLMSSRLAGKGSKITFTAVSYSLDELIEHLESQFDDMMSWDNYGKWEVDHIKPDSSFNYSSVDDEAFKDCWALSNLQPMWAQLNRSKSNKFAGGC